MVFFIKSVGLIGLSILIGYFYSPHFDDEVIKDIGSTLLNVSAAVFAIAGLWISQIYPEVMKAFSLPNVAFIDIGERAKRIETLILVIATSMLVIISFLAFQLLVPLEKVLQTTSVAPYTHRVKVIAIIYLSFLQIAALGRLAYIMFSLSNQVYRKLKEAKAQRKLR